MSIIVYWAEAHDISRMQRFAPTQLSEALNYCQHLRSLVGVSHVCMSSENPNSVGKPGVDEVKNGKTPDGVDYTWSKADRAGKTRKR